MPYDAMLPSSTRTSTGSNINILDNFEGGKEAVIVDAVHAFSLQGCFELQVFSRNSDAEDHRDDNRRGVLASGNAVACESVHVSVCCGVVALCRGTEEAGNGTGHGEEVE
jgi:hypothetical protein